MAENRGICPGCSQMVTTAHPRTVDESTGKYWHRPCFDAKDKVADATKAGAPPAEDRGLCPVCNLMVTTAHPRTVDEPTGKYYHRSCYEDKDKAAAVAAAADAEGGEEGEAEGDADADANKSGKRKKCTIEGCKKSSYKNDLCATHFRETSGFTTVNFAKMMGGDNSMDMKQMTKNYKAMTMKLGNKKGPVVLGKAKTGGKKGNAMILASKKFAEAKAGEEAGAAEGDDAGEEAGSAAAESPVAAAPSGDFVRCQMCDENDPPHAATTRCQDCEEDMCDVIARAHQKAKMSKGHTLVLLSDLKKADAGAAAS